MVSSISVACFMSSMLGARAAATEKGAKIPMGKQTFWSDVMAQVPRTFQMGAADVHAERDAQTGADEKECRVPLREG